jgi:sugar O-acyltransferase (sialic acid O-acetyltransferase NeuD family)
VTREPILLVGAGGHSRACIDVIEQEGRFAIKGLVGLPKEVGLRILDYPVLATDEGLPKLLADCANVLIAVGQIKTPEPRIRLFNLLQQNNCVLPTIVSPRAYISPHASLETGTIVMHGAVVNAGAVVGKNCIINSQSLVEHDVIIKDHCHIATAATINSGVRIGTGTFIGSNSSVKQGVNIGDRCVIGMGQQVLANCETGVCIP